MKIIDMTEAERKVFADVLDHAAEIIARRCCNDYEIDDTPEGRAIIEAIEKEGEPDEPVVFEPRDGKIMTMDWLLLLFFKRIVKQGGAS